MHLMVKLERSYPTAIQLSADVQAWVVSGNQNQGKTYGFAAGMRTRPIRGPWTGHDIVSGPYRKMMPKQTTDVDRLVGLRITALRKARGLSQTALGTAVGVTFQQVQKYEKGQNRVGAGRLREIARLLEVPVSAFFDENDGPASQEQAEVFGFLRAHGAVDLLRAFASIEDDQLRREVLAIVRSAARLDRKKDAALDA
jgi:transcriptional regulator with XRE-family HTH domain